MAYPRKGGFNAFCRQARRAHEAMPDRVQFGYIDPDGVMDAYINEFGLPDKGIPERPALRRAVADSLDAMRAELARMVRASGTMSVTAADAKRLGEIVTDRLEASIRAGVKPENAPWKGLDKPSLQFTGKLLASIDVQVIQ